MADLIMGNTDDEVEKYEEAYLIASNPPPMDSAKSKTLNFNRRTGKNDVLLPLSSGGYAKVGEEPIPRVDQVKKYARELQGMNAPFDMADYDAAGFTAEEVQAAGIMPVQAPTSGRSEPMTEGETLIAQRQGESILSAYDPTLREDVAASMSEIFQAVGLDSYQARQVAEGLVGNPESTRKDLGLGVADMTPLALIFGGQEGGRTFMEGYNTGNGVNMGLGALEAGLSFLEALPMTAAGAKGLKKQIPAFKAAIADVGREAQKRIDAEGTTMFSNPVGPVVDRGLVAAGRLADTPNAQRPDQVLVRIPIKDVEHGESAMPGGKLTLPGSQQLIQEYASKETPLPPIDIMSLDEDGAGKAFIADGSHRFEAAKLRGQDFVEAYVSKDELADLPSAEVVNRVSEPKGRLADAKPSAADLRRQANIQRFGYDPNDPVAEVKAPTETEPGIIAFHGSGADFDEFKLEKIGTGEGAQAFGYGLYFTEKEDIAKFYRDSVGAGNEVTYKGKVIQDLDQDFADENNIAHMAGQQETPEDMQRVVADEVRRTRNNLAGIKQSIKDFQENPDAYPLKFHGMEISMETAEKQREFLQRRLDAALEVQDNIGQIQTKPAGTMYQVGLHVNPDELIDYDKTFDEQSAFVQEAILKVLDEVNLDDAMNMGVDVFSPPYNGNEEQALQATKKLMLDNFSTVSFLNDWSVLRGAENSGEELLEKHGVKGITYKAQRGVGARNVPETGADNYVIFDDKLISIMKKYGIVGPVAVSAMASQEQEEI